MSSLPKLPERALSLYAPWCWAILHAGKDIENRSWRPWSGDARFRGWFWLHASLFGGPSGRKREDLDDECFAASSVAQEAGRHADRRELADWSLARRGQILGRVRVVDAVERSASPWFFGPLGLVLAEPIALVTPVACKGALGFWQVPAPVLEQLRTAESQSPSADAGKGAP